MKTTRLYTLTKNMLLGELPTKQTIPPFTLQTSGEVVVLFCPCPRPITCENDISDFLSDKGLTEDDADVLIDAFFDVLGRIPKVERLSNNTADGFVCGLKLS